MQSRRTFFGAALAFLSFGLLPRPARAKLTPKPDVFGVDDKVFNQAVRDIYERGPRRVRFDDYFQMMEAIVEHVAVTGDDVLVADDPQSFPPCLGYVAVSKEAGRNDTHFVINLADLKASLDKPEHNKPVKGANENAPENLKGILGDGPSKADLVRLNLKTQEGKVRLAMAMQGAGRKRAKARA